MDKIITRRLREEKDGIEGYIAGPERNEKGPAILMIHQHSGLTGYLKTAAYRFAQLGYMAVIPNLYHMLGYPAETHIDKGTEIQNKTPDPDFVRVIDRGWRYCLSRGDVDGRRVGVVGYCMGGRLGIHFVAATPAVRAFVAYYPSVRDEEPTRIRPRHPCDAAREIKCPSMILYGGHDQHSTFPVQQRVMESFHSNGQSLEWHYFHFGYHGFASTESDGYQPYLADLVWPLVTEFLGRELTASAVTQQNWVPAEDRRSAECLSKAVSGRHASAHCAQSALYENLRVLRFFVVNILFMVWLRLCRAELFVMP